MSYQHNQNNQTPRKLHQLVPRPTQTPSRTPSRQPSLHPSLAPFRPTANTYIPTPAPTPSPFSNVPSLAPTAAVAGVAIGGPIAVAVVLGLGVCACISWRLYKKCSSCRRAKPASSEHRPLFLQNSAVSSLYVSYSDLVGPESKSRRMSLDSASSGQHSGGESVHRQDDPNQQGRSGSSSDTVVNLAVGGADGDPDL
jgi:hypothetical protein